MTPDPPDIDHNNDDVVLSPSNSLGNPECGDDLAPSKPRDTLEDTGPEPPHLLNVTAPSSSLKDLRDKDMIHLKEIQLVMDFIEILHSASLDNLINGLSGKALDCLRKPLQIRLLKVSTKTPDMQ